MLYLISIGLWDEKDLSLRGLETAKACDRVYAEFYTVNINTTASELSKLIGKKVTELKRKDLENDSKRIIKEAKNKDIALLVGGDALTATTHISLIGDASKQKVPYKVIHGSSVLTAVGETGLQLYKFGKVTTLSKDFPKSCHDAIMLNKEVGLHSLVLLDIGMTVLEGIKTLMKKLNPDAKAVAACHLGGKTIIRYGTLKELSKLNELKKTPAVIIIPGKMHFLEEEYLDAL